MNKIVNDNTYRMYSGVAVDYLKIDMPTSMDSLHYHNDYEFCFLVSGGRKNLVSNTIYNLIPKCAMFIEPEIPHQATVTLNIPMERYVLYISKEVMEQIFKENPAIKPILSTQLCHFSDDSFKKVIKILKSIRNELVRKDVFSASALKSLVHEIIVEFCRNVFEEKENKASSTKNDINIQAALNYINENYYEKITQSNCAKISNMSLSHFSRQFSLITAMNFNDYVNKIRIEKSVEILRNNPSINVTALANTVGFNSGSYFTSVFHSMMGETPTEYKKRFKQ